MAGEGREVGGKHWHVVLQYKSVLYSAKHSRPLENALEIRHSLLL